MRLLLELSMECESLARSEAMAAAETLGSEARMVHQEPGVLVMDSDADPCALSARLALCHSISEHLFSCPPDGLGPRVSEIDVPGPVRVHSTRIGRSFHDIDLSSMNSSLGAALGKTRGVDLHSPRSEVRVVLSSGASVGRLLSRIDRSSFERRKARNMPFNHPISIHPKFARALVNLARVPSGGRLLDPFCGTGAIVLEAVLSGLEAMGTDLSSRMVEGARENLSSQGVEAALARCDVGSIAAVVGAVDGIATDPPYGRSTSTNGEPVGELLNRALGSFSEVLDKGARVAIAVHEVELLETDDDFEVVETHPLWVHRSLTRHFCVLVKK